jgi:hypothetical protein
MSKDSGGCGCLLLIALACLIGGGIWQGVAILAGGWLLYLIFIGVSIGIVALIAKAIAGK